MTQFCWLCRGVSAAVGRRAASSAASLQRWNLDHSCEGGARYTLESEQQRTPEGRCRYEEFCARFLKCAKSHAAEIDNAQGAAAPTAATHQSLAAGSSRSETPSDEQNVRIAIAKSRCALKFSVVAEYFAGSSDASVQRFVESQRQLEREIENAESQLENGDSDFISLCDRLHLLEEELIAQAPAPQAAC